MVVVVGIVSIMDKLYYRYSDITYSFWRLSLDKISMSDLLVSVLITPDGTILQSYNRHDYVTHEDKNGGTYMLDGGTDYVRSTTNKTPGKYITLDTESDHGEVRKWFRWGTYGKGGKDKLKRVLLMDLSTDHIEAILETQHQVPQKFKDMFNKELEFRKSNGR